ncbi:MAG TPA: DUF6438 domain-containing protein [Candidatus Acidoferrum sp.]
MQKNARLKPTQLQLLSEVLLSLNLALVLLYCCLVRSFVEASYSKNTSGAYAFLYDFLRAAVRLNRILHYQPSGYEKYVRWPNAGGRLGVELAFALTTVFLGVLFLAVLRLSRNSRNYNNLLGSFGGLVFLLAFPLTYVLVSGRSDNRTLASALPVAIPELLCAAVVCLIYLRRKFSGWGMGIVVLLHYGLWALVYQGGGTGDTLYGPIPPWLLLLLIPIGAAAWLYYCQVSRRDSSIELSKELWSKQLLIAVAVSVVGLSALWLPGRGYSLVHATNRDSLTIETWHSNCQIGCPVYKITVHGNGAVEYVGEQFVKVRGTQASSLNEEQVQAALVGFDRANFFSLEDQAFAWGYHTARVSVRITVDGRTKEVTSDICHVGAKSGLQARFVDAAAKLDRIIGTDRWVKCGEARCLP